MSGRGDTCYTYPTNRQFIDYEPCQEEDQVMTEWADVQGQKWIGGNSVAYIGWDKESDRNLRSAEDDKKNN